ERRRATPPRPRARSEANRPARDAGGDQIAGPGGAGRAAARDVPARADESDPKGARRRRSVEGADGASRQTEQDGALERGEEGGRARAWAPRAFGSRIDGSAGHSHVSRVDRRASLEQPL